MCGICGVASLNLGDFPLEEMTSTLSHRGPDDCGIYKDDYVGLGHRRLSIIDLSSGRQPIFNEDRSKCIVFNGEIYNFPELRDRLIARGHRFSTKSDTETILHAYEEWGEGCVTHLNGMFAFAIWDTVSRELFVARDRLGIKPLFYAIYSGKFYFSSEMKAILADDEFPRKMDEAALASYFTFSYIPAPLTIFSGIRKLLPGHALTWKGGEITIKRYWDLSFVPDRGKNERFFIDGFLDLFQDSVEKRLMSEVPLGAFLSGGIDSSAIVAMMTKGGTGSVNTFCIGFGGDTGGYLDERKYARQVAERYAARHRDYTVVPRLDGLVEKIVRAFDEPFADDSTIPSFFVCQQARKSVTVALSGLGGDEAFAGYERYLGFRLRGIYNMIPTVFRQSLFQPLIEKLPERTDGHYTINHMKRFVRSNAVAPDVAYLGYLSIMDPDLRKSLFSDPDRFHESFEACEDIIRDYYNSAQVSGRQDSLNRVLYCDAKSYLPDDILAVTDRMSMHHSLEVRVPFIDHRLVEFCATIPPEMKMKWFRKKYLLKKAVAGLVPAGVISHRKQGFVGPMAQWLKNDLKSYSLKTLSETELGKHGLFNNALVGKIVEQHYSGKEIHDTLIWSLLVFQKWYDLYMENN